jgi:hypothetical protein
MSSASRRFQRRLGFRPYFFTPASQLTTTVSGGNSAAAPGAVEIRKRLPSARHVTPHVPGPGRHVGARFKQGLGRGAVEGCSRGLNLHGHELPVRRHVEQLLAIAPPARLRSARGRNLPFSRHGFPVRREGHYINFGASGLDGVVGQLSAVRGKLTLHLIELALQQRNRLSVAGFAP